ncbi:hypothetical protein ACH4E7_27040 [Kitasatospora sp. NPDC018058]|uniref:hypothetical protein n=1 Tax=Kitasatospora sp. NPDC018058 TaxID=3364025 RepID=UPI0037C183BE
MVQDTLPAAGYTIAVGAPAAPLRRYVLDYRGYRMVLDRPRRRLEVPTDVVTLALAFEGTMRLSDAVAPTAGVHLGSIAAGLRRTATIAEHAGVLYGLSVSLTPQGAFRAFGPVAGELGGQWAEAGDVLGPGCARWSGGWPTPRAGGPDSPCWTGTSPPCSPTVRPGNRASPGPGTSSGAPTAWCRSAP